jgi:hypothetical protein
MTGRTVQGPRGRFLEKLQYGARNVVVWAREREFAGIMKRAPIPRCWVGSKKSTGEIEGWFFQARISVA